MIKYKHQLNAFSGKQVLLVVLSRDFIYIRIPVGHCIKGYFVELFLPIDIVVRFIVGPVVVDNCTQVIEHPDWIRYIEQGK
jgi:hypothetical protein